jgi:hypothetical protein
MGISDFFLPERLPQQMLYAGDRHAEVFTLQNRRIVGRQRVEGATLDEAGADPWARLAEQLGRGATGIVLNASPFIYNFFEFDKLPWQAKALRELVTWRLQKIFPENIEAYDHRFFKLDRKRVFSILVKKTFLERTEQWFKEIGVPLIYIGNSTLEILNRLLRAKAPPDFFIESDSASSILVFQKRRSPIYIRKFKSGPGTDTAAEIGKTVQFVRNNYGIEPRRYWLIDHQGEASQAADTAERLAAENFSRLSSGLGNAPHIPGCP